MDNNNLNNNNKNTDFSEWFKKHSKNIVTINYESGRKYELINCTLNECQDNFVSVIRCHDDYLLFLDNANKIIITLIVRKEDNIEKLKFIGAFKCHDIACFTPFGLYLTKAPQWVFVEKKWIQGIIRINKFDHFKWFKLIILFI